jgi:hypothetical protein
MTHVAGHVDEQEAWTDDPNPKQIPKHVVHMSQAYIFSWSCVALATSIGAMDQYAGGSLSTRWLGYIGTGCAGLLLLGLIIEYTAHKKTWKPLDDWLGWMVRHNLPDRGTHVAVQLLTMTSVGIAFVNMHVEEYNWQYGTSVSLLLIVFVYNVMYTPSILVSTAAYNHLPTAFKRVLTLQHDATTYVWKRSYVEDRLMPSTA